MLQPSPLSPSFTHCLPCSYGKNCTPTRRRRQQSRRCRIPAQHRRAAMTRPPALLPPKKITSCSYRRCCLAATALAVTFTATAPLSQSRLWNACLRRVERLVHQPRSNLFSRQPSAAATATKASNIHFHAWRHQRCPPQQMHNFARKHRARQESHSRRHARVRCVTMLLQRHYTLR